ncbi:hypothetical protein E1212_08595 [Jiangella ureilytica]|uniref:Uncharacterized protein n=1 Tax=Jiangella ureilytica TaxID=2530374 RepID=A0A4V2XXC1_9ACTN|nr:hypothetical protein [Jiangella ureilytica]TDC52635.1 hypothetical protein E1212_08595 [Jiangella ureilytica]
MTSRDDPGEPFDLGVIGPAPDPDPGPDGGDGPATPRGRSGWRRWGVLAAAVVVGAAGGLAVAEARDDAAGYARIELFGGPEQMIIFPGRPKGELTVAVLNAGERPVEILGVEIDGVTLADGAEPPEPVAVGAGSWVTYVQRDLVVDCSGELPQAMRMRVRTESGEERLVDVEPPDDHESLRGFWYTECQLGPSGLRVGKTSLIETGADGVVLGIELVNDGLDDLRLGAIASRAPGFTLTVDAADRSVPAGQSLTVVTTWTVRDCDTALRATGGSLAVRTLTGDSEAEQVVVLPDHAFTSLARLSGQACPATIQE